MTVAMNCESFRDIDLFPHDCELMQNDGKFPKARATETSEFCRQTRFVMRVSAEHRAASWRRLIGAASISRRACTSICPDISVSPSR